jgi:hypothetical protein
MVLVTTGDPDESGQLAQRQIEGVYTLDEAVNTLCQNVEVLDRAQKLADLKALVEKGEVQVNQPRTLDITPIPLKARTFHEVAYWDNLNNNWLSKYQFIDWRFPDPLERLRPDWSYWNCDHLSLENAISLCVNITPYWISNKVIGSKNKLKISFEYSPKLTNALNWAQSPDCLWRYDNPSEFKATNQVKLCEFSRWVVKEKPDWVIPSEFKALARLGEVLIKQNNKGKKGRPKSLTEDEVARLIQMRKDKPTLSHQSLADEFGVSRTLVGKLLKKDDIY